MFYSFILLKVSEVYVSLSPPTPRLTYNHLARTTDTVTSPYNPILIASSSHCNSHINMALPTCLRALFIAPFKPAITFIGCICGPCSNKIRLILFSRSNLLIDLTRRQCNKTKLEASVTEGRMAIL